MSNPRNRRTIKKVLVVRNDRFGEFLLIIPALRALKQAFEDCRLTVIVGPQVTELARCVPCIDEVITWQNTGHTLSQRVRLWREIRKSRFDASVIFNPTKEFHALTFFAGIPVRAGYDRKYGFLLSHRVADSRHLAQKHEIDYNLELAGLLGARPGDKSMPLTLNDAIISSLISPSGELLPERFVAVHPFTSDPVKQWPYERFGELVSRIRRVCGLRVVVVGAPEEGARQKDFGQEGIDFVGKTTLPQLAVLLKRSACLVSCDSGPVHLASCVKTPSVVLFRNDLPGKTARRWGPVSPGSAVIEKANLADITVDEVVERVTELVTERT